MVLDFDEELKRVMVHGLLHIIGYNDKTSSEKEKTNYVAKRN